MDTIFSFVNNIDVVQAVVLIIGLLFIIFEMFNPGFGAAGLVGILFLLAGIIITAKTVFEALVMLLLLLAFLGIALTLVLHSATKGRLSKSLILNDSLKKENGFIGTDDLEYFVGKEGISLTDLRPSGTAEFDGVKLDVVTEGGYITKNNPVKVIHVSGRRIVVKVIA